MREVVHTLMRRDVDLVHREIAPYYQDLYDHVLRATEWTDSLRDLVSTIVETNLTIQGNRLTSSPRRSPAGRPSSPFPLPSPGFYGQNLPYPGFAEGSGFITSTLLIVVLSFAPFITFKRRDWL